MPDNEFALAFGVGETVSDLRLVVVQETLHLRHMI